MNPSELKDIQREMALIDADLAAALELTDDSALPEYLSGAREIPAGIADQAERLLDDWRFARLILERKIRPQYEALVAASPAPSSVPGKIALVTQLDRDDPDHKSATRAEGRLSLVKQIDKLAKAWFASENIEVVSKVEFVMAAKTGASDDLPTKLGVLGVRVEIVET